MHSTGKQGENDHDGENDDNTCNNDRAPNDTGSEGSDG